MSSITTALDRIGNIKTVEILEKATELKLDAATTQLVVARAILENFGRISTPFRYRQPLDPETPTGSSSVARSFEHADWFDGQSVVQAGETASEEGFNARFHAIESDLDALASEIRRAFEEVAGLRRQLATMFDDIRAALDRLDARSTENAGPQPQPPIFDWIRPEMIIPPQVGDPGRFQVPKDFGNKIIEFADTPGAGVAFGKPARKLSREVFAGRSVDVWSTDAGMVLVPVATEAGGSVTGLASGGLERAGAAADWLATNEANIRAEVGGGEFSVGDVREKFGDTVLGNGSRLAEALDKVAPESRFAQMDELASAIAAGEAQGIVSEGRVLDEVVGAVGLTPGPSPVAEVDIGALRMLDEPSRQALGAAGITTVGALASADAGTIASAFSAAGIEADVGTTARIVAISRGLGGLGRR